MGYAKFRAAFVGGTSNEWSVTPDDRFLKQNEATHFTVRYNPHSPGISNSYLVIETEVSWRYHIYHLLLYFQTQITFTDMFALSQDFKMTWKVVGSTGEYEF